MCGRFAIAPDRADAWASVADYLGKGVEQTLIALKPRFNIAPTLQIPIVIQDRRTDEIRAELARWGFVPHWHKPGTRPPMNNNCRWEGAHTKPTWRDAWVRSRCLIAATHWYEWREEMGLKMPFAHALDGRGFFFAGLCSYAVLEHGTEPVLTAAIVTRDASPSVAHIHDRMPVVLAPAAWRRWLAPELNDPASIHDLLANNAMLQVTTWRVSRAVNSSRNEGADLLLPAEGPT